jgi:hypothetical protein
MRMRPDAAPPASRRRVTVRQVIVEQDERTDSRGGNMVAREIVLLC